MPQDVALEVKKKADSQHTLNQDHVKADVPGNGQDMVEGLTVTDIDPNSTPETIDSVGLAIPAKIAVSLSQSVRNQLATMGKRDQEAFVKSFQDRSASLVMAYLTSLIYCHYVLLGRWAMSGWMWLSLFVAGTLGVIWWLIDLVRMPRMVREYNDRLAAELVQKLQIAAAAPTPLAGS